jgi:hypothetical protein
MNIFVLSPNPVKAAQMQCDKHVVKMCLETAQMLSTISNGPYKPTHANHPCTLWAGANRTNYNWLVKHGLALCDEYTYRYDKRHKCRDIIESLSTPPEHIPIGITPFAQCMPDECKHTDPMVAYRQYYHTKSAFAQWTKRSAPHWWMQPEYLPFVSQ